MLRRLNPKTTILLICDFQEHFRKAIPLFSNLVKNTNRIILGAQELNIPIIGGEQNAECLGKTIRDLNSCRSCGSIDRMQMSMWVPELQNRFADKYDPKPCDALLCGVEAHGAVEQTAVDLIDNDINVYLLADCIASRSPVERDLAIERMRRAGVIISTYENALYWLMPDQNHEKYQAIQKLIRTPSADMSLSPNKNPHVNGGEETANKMLL